MSRNHRSTRTRLGVVAAALLLLACETVKNPLDVETSSRIPAENVESPGNAQLLVDGAVADFECAFASYVVQSATVGEEFIYAQQTADRVPSDRRNTLPTDPRYATNSCTGLGIYAPLQTARSSADNVLTFLKGWTDTQVSTSRIALIATASAYSGYSYLLLGEGFCTLAFSRVNADRSIDYGGEISRDSTFKIAIARFTESIAAATASPASTNNTSILRMAYLGRARAKLNTGDYAGAKADAQQIPAGYVRNATYSTTVGRRNNLVFNDNSITNNSSSIGEPYRSMTGDPRVVVTQGTSTSATGIRHYYQSKYTTVADPIPLAKYQEAQLIIAEAEIRANNLPAALTILAAERTRGAQPAFTGVTQGDYLAELIDQRRRELFLESHHLEDIIRLAIAIQPVAGTAYHFGGNYGSQLCFPLPSSERLNNPKIGS
ncbi:MAG: RagB/SusD family nutrient uptake outer membrane protein [Gemmatimonadaceae bacterium]